MPLLSLHLLAWDPTTSLWAWTIRRRFTSLLRMVHAFMFMLLNQLSTKNMCIWASWCLCITRTCMQINLGPVKYQEHEYLGTVVSCRMNAEYAAVRFEGKVNLHLVGCWVKTLVTTWLALRLTKLYYRNPLQKVSQWSLFKRVSLECR